MGSRTERLPKNPGSNGGERDLFVGGEPLFDPREQWANAPERLLRYKGGKVFDESGNVLYEYPPGNERFDGSRLLILSNEVMDSCQRPWAQETVRAAFAALDERGRKQNVDILERGFGMGIVAGEFMDELRKRRGTYTVIELNKQVTEFARTSWVRRQRQMDRTRAASELGGGTYNGSRVEINIIHGDAYEQTKILAEQGKKFDIIASDTYPLTDKERAINDLEDLETLIKCLKTDGVFTFFGYFKGWQGGLNSNQRDKIDKFFRETHVTHVSIDPPPDYQYMQTPIGPIRLLPVVICKNPIL